VSYGAVIPVRRGQWKYLEDVGRAAEVAGWEYLFSDEGPYAGDNDSMSAALLLARASNRARVGTSIAITYLRHPYLLASTSAILQEVSGDRFVLGLGVSHPAINASIGIDSTRPISDIRDYVATVRGFLRDKGGVPIWLAALRPRMSRVAGEIAEGVNFHHVPLSFLPQMLASLREGEELGDTKTTVAAYARIVLNEDLDLARRVGRATVASYCELVAYQDLYSLAGYGDEMESFREALRRGDREAARRAITDELLDDVLVLGPASRCHEQLERMKDAGIEVILFAPLATDASDLKSLFEPLLSEFASAGNSSELRAGST
jgi:5,10-methylenetetrahydromethanopterin reductase